MKDFIVRPRRTARTANRVRATRPLLEGLEDRLLLYATTGDKFAYGSRITWSIVPDGTNLGGATSNLSSTLNGDIGYNQWELAVNDAFAQWENVANVNFRQVGDNGAPTGSGSNQQSSPYFGDIRISGYSQANNILAYTLLPPKANGGSDSGDIFINTSQPWSINGGGYDLETVLVHEIGHALGLGHSADTNAVMYAYYGGANQVPDPDDIQGVDSIWGPRQEDAIAQANNNFVYTQAANINSYLSPWTNQIVLPSQDVASDSENYWFKVTTPANASSNFSVTIQSTALSELSPAVWIYNTNPTVLSYNAATVQAYGATITTSIGNATPNTTYLIRVSGTGGSNGDGAYAMTVNMGNSSVASVAPPNTTVYAQPDQGGGGIYEQISGSGGAGNVSGGPGNLLGGTGNLLGGLGNLLGGLSNLLNAVVSSSSNLLGLSYDPNGNAVGGWTSVLGGTIGGFNTPANTPPDIPDMIHIAGGVVPGDFLQTGKKPTKDAVKPVQINVPHPTVSRLPKLAAIPVPKAHSGRG